MGRPVVLVTGGAGYIGSHCCVSLLESNYDVVAIDNLANSSVVALERVEKITGRRVKFIRGDVRNTEFIKYTLQKYDVFGVVHFAALKSVEESLRFPLKYYDNNIGGTISLVQAMKAVGVRNLVFSSSATVYGDPDTVPIKENAELKAVNTYGRTKLGCEEVLRDAISTQYLNVAILRYFNPIGAHPSGMIGEDPQGVPNNLLPLVAQVAVGAREQLAVYGGDYPTRDGTGIRDYIHVVDLAEAHVAALRRLASTFEGFTLNIGTGRGTSVLELIQAFQCASNQQINYRISERRPGDVAECWADPSLAQHMLKWSAKKSLADMCADAWRWQVRNPNGYRDEERGERLT